MDQEKIGKFIQTLRKENELTQKELAEKLGVTDRAISKWENGRGMPEVSLMKPLCEILGITVGELLSGERIDRQEYPEKSEFSFLNTIDHTNRDVKKKNTYLRIALSALAALLLTVFLLIYLVPLPRNFFRADEELQIFSVTKTLPIAPEGTKIAPYAPVDFIEQEITEKIDLEVLKNVLRLMNVTIYREGGHSYYWTGDVIYSIDGCIRNGRRAGQYFRVYLGDERNYLMGKPSNRYHVILNRESWLRLMEELEGWDKDYRETFQWETERTFSLFYEGKLYSGKGELLELPQDVRFEKHVSGISSFPDEEGECSFGHEGPAYGVWTADGQTYLGIQITHDQAYGIPID